jgi:anti-anti-sigma factor
MAQEMTSAASWQRATGDETRRVLPFEMQVRHGELPRARVVLTGKLDADSATAARQAFASAVSAGYSEIEVDGSALTFFDVAGLDVLECAQRDCAEHGGLLVLLDPPPMLRSVLGVTGLEWLLNDWRT